jgi:lysyl-tRNA synthetase class 2
MKRLLSLGSGVIYQMRHVFREGDWGSLHNPEFMMVEWYRLGFTLSQLIEETLDLIRLFVGKLPSEKMSYRNAFQKYLGIDYLHATPWKLLEIAKSHNITLSEKANQWSKETLLDLLMSFIIEPQLGKGKLTVITDYPATHAALAKIEQKEDEPVAQRFEISFEGIELANGYHELTDPKEQRVRLHQENEKRKLNGKETLPLDEHFLLALERGIPDCCGVAVGFDRLMLLNQKKPLLADILPISWAEA